MWADGQSSAMPDQSSEVPDPLLLLHTRCPSNNLPTNSSLSLETHLGCSFTGVIHLLHVLWPLGCSRLPLLGNHPLQNTAQAPSACGTASLPLRSSRSLYGHSSLRWTPPPAAVLQALESPLPPCPLAPAVEKRGLHSPKFSLFPLCPLMCS